MMVEPGPSPPLPRLPIRRPESHKGDYGHALVVGGSRGMAGAVALAGGAALRGGAGLVTLVVPEAIQATVAGFEACYMVAGAASDEAGRLADAAEPVVADYAARATVMAVGPGLGRSNTLDRSVRHWYRTLERPLVVDADGLNALAADPDCLAQPGGPRILTPHPGEFARLVGESVEDVERRDELAIQCAKKWGVVMVLKGHATLVTDGEHAFHGTTGNPGMATGGAGDVLTGLITALVSQGMTPLDAARLGVHVHGLAGDLAAHELGQVGLIARDLLRFLPRALWESGCR
ncbi:MAG: NAD(P)H-hydrate dehydratase [Pirellulales bacterium]